LPVQHQSVTGALMRAAIELDEAEEIERDEEESE
jgi:hypothetical protein